MTRKPSDEVKNLVKDTRTKAYILVTIREDLDDELGHITLFGDRHPEYRNNVRLCAGAISTLMHDIVDDEYFDKDKDTSNFISDVIDEVQKIEREGSDE